MKPFARAILGTAVGVAALAGSLAVGPASAFGDVAEAPGQVFLVQGLPGGGVDVSIDGEPTEQGVAFKTVLGPYDLSPGSHTIEFSSAGAAAGGGVLTSLDVVSGASTDVVVHLPADTDGDPVVNSYPAPLEPITPGKARVLVAHTATVAPADVVVDGQPVFTNIANGEFAQADVPSGAHVVELLPTGLAEPVLLGPLDVRLVDSSLSMIYAVGNPDDDTMDLIVHGSELAADGSVVPRRIDTGSAGLAAGVEVHPFGSATTSRGPGTAVPIVALALGVLGAAVLSVRRRQLRRG